MPGREEFMEGIRSRLQEYKPTRAPDVPWTEKGTVETVPPQPGDLPGMFLRELRALGGHGELVQDAAAAREYILDLISNRGVRSIIRWDDAVLEELGIDERLREMGIEVTVWRDGESPREAAAGADVGLSGAGYAVAETGSLVLSSGRGEGRVVTLLPPTYVAVVKAERIVYRVEDVIRRYDGQGVLPSSLCFHTGPSRSADIEQSLAIGVHGPGDVHVLVLEGGDG